MSTGTENPIDETTQKSFERSNRIPTPDSPAAEEHKNAHNATSTPATGGNGTATLTSPVSPTPIVPNQGGGRHWSASGSGAGNGHSGGHEYYRGGGGGRGRGRGGREKRSSFGHTNAQYSEQPGIVPPMPHPYTSRQFIESGGFSPVAGNQNMPMGGVAPYGFPVYPGSVIDNSASVSTPSTPTGTTTSVSSTAVSGSTGGSPATVMEQAQQVAIYPNFYPQPGYLINGVYYPGQPGSEYYTYSALPGGGMYGGPGPIPLVPFSSEYPYQYGPGANTGAPANPDSGAVSSTPATGPTGPISHSNVSVAAAPFFPSQPASQFTSGQGQSFSSGQASSNQPQTVQGQPSQYGVSGIMAPNVPQFIPMSSPQSLQQQTGAGIHQQSPRHSAPPYSSMISNDNRRHVSLPHVGATQPAYHYRSGSGGVRGSLSPAFSTGVVTGAVTPASGLGMGSIGGYPPYGQGMPAGSFPSAVPGVGTQGGQQVNIVGGGAPTTGYVVPSRTTPLPSPTQQTRYTPSSRRGSLEAGSVSSDDLARERNSTGDVNSRTNLYIRGLAPSATDAWLYELCKEYGRITSSKAILDLVTQDCKGYGFVMYESEPEAKAAMEELGQKGYQVSFAKTDPRSYYDQESFNARLQNLQDEESTNIYISNLPLDMDEEGLKEIFLPHKVVSNKILRDAMLQSRGVGFARMETREAANQVIEALNGAILPGCTQKLQVRFADSTAQKRLKLQHQQSQTVRRRLFQRPTREYGQTNAVVGSVSIVPTVSGDDVSSRTAGDSISGSKEIDDTGADSTTDERGFVSGMESVPAEEETTDFERYGGMAPHGIAFMQHPPPSPMMYSNVPPHMFPQHYHLLPPSPSPPPPMIYGYYPTMATAIPSGQPTQPTHQNHQMPHQEDQGDRYHYPGDDSQQNEQSQGLEEDVRTVAPSAFVNDTQTGNGSGDGDGVTDVDDKLRSMKIY